MIVSSMVTTEGGGFDPSSTSRNAMFGSSRLKDQQHLYILARGNAGYTISFTLKMARP